MEGLTNSTITGATVFCLCLGTACARCWSIRRPSTTSDCRRCDSGFLGEFRQGILTDERKLTRRKSVRAEAGPWTLFGRTILQYGDCRAEEGRFCHPVTNETRCDTESRVRDVLPSDSERPSRKLFVPRRTALCEIRPRFGGIGAWHPGGNHSERLFVRVGILPNILGGGGRQ